MSIICPTVLASNLAEYNNQLRNISGFSERVQIDLMDKDFAKSESQLGLEDIWWPHHIKADIHLMYQKPLDQLDKLLHLKPNMVIIHYEADVHHMHFAAELHKEDIKAGLALLPETKVADVEEELNSFDHMLIFSGDLGHFGGQANLSLANKAKQAKERHPGLEIGWDGGVNLDNAKQLADAGIDVLNVGGYIQNVKNPEENYQTLIELIKN